MLRTQCSAGIHVPEVVFKCYPQCTIRKFLRTNFTPSFSNEWWKTPLYVPESLLLGLYFNWLLIVCVRGHVVLPCLAVIQCFQVTEHVASFPLLHCFGASCPLWQQQEQVRMICVWEESFGYEADIHKTRSDVSYRPNLNHSFHPTYHFCLKDGDMWISWMYHLVGKELAEWSQRAVVNGLMSSDEWYPSGVSIGTSTI